MFTGRLIGHRDGYGFVVPDAPVAGVDQDIYISPDGMGSALNGDRVEVQVLRAKPDGRREGRILSVTGRAHKTVVGQFHCGQHYNYVKPFDHRIPFEIVIPRGEEWPREEVRSPESGLVARTCFPMSAVLPRVMVSPPTPVARTCSPRSAALPRLKALHRQGRAAAIANSAASRNSKSRVQKSEVRSARDLDGLVVDVEITS